MESLATNFRFSGHETFVCRYAWLPKAIREIAKAPTLFSNDDSAMVALGVGKNMVRSIRFWAELSRVIEPMPQGAGYATSPFGQQLLGHEGHDPFLEDPRTLWLLHWKIATNPTQPLYFWHQMLSYWHRADFCESEITPFFEKNVPVGLSLRSANTIKQGYRVFVNTYVPTRGRKGQVAEDNLDSPLTELDLVRPIGDRRSLEGDARETIYAFNLEDKPGVTPEVFAYCLQDFWNQSYPNENTLSFRAITAAPGSPGQIFKLPELAVRRHLDLLKQVTSNSFAFEESSTIQQAVKKKRISSEAALDSVYSNSE
jgi:hypothetical protein